LLRDKQSIIGLSRCFCHALTCHRQTDRQTDRRNWSNNKAAALCNKVHPSPKISPDLSYHTFTAEDYVSSETGSDASDTLRRHYVAFFRDCFSS